MVVGEAKQKNVWCNKEGHSAVSHRQLRRFLSHRIGNTSVVFLRHHYHHHFLSLYTERYGVCLSIFLYFPFKKA